MGGWCLTNFWRVSLATRANPQNDVGPENMTEISRDRIIGLAKKIASRLGQDSLSRVDFIKESGISTHYLYTLFPDGGWTEVCKYAGLKTEGSGYPIEEESLLDEFNRVASELGKIPTWNQFQAKSKISADTLRKRLGGTQGTLKKYTEWLKENFPDSPLLNELQSKSKHEIPTPPVQYMESPLTEQTQWPKNDKTEFGAPINFRGLTHAPINEQGVVYLFGMVSYELGFIVESIQSSFPDCEAKRCVDIKRKRWQRVKIEFEYQSSNFRQHGHDPTQCDLIVCWEHNWSECPLEVLELRTLINKLDG